MSTWSKSLLAATTLIASAVFVLQVSSLSTGAKAQATFRRGIGSPNNNVMPVTNPIDSCAFNRRSSGLCFGSPQFLTYAAAASSCGASGGRLPTLGELIAYRFGPGSAETGIECSSDWDAGTQTLWCVGEKGQISGTGIPGAAGLSSVPAEFRCVTYLK